MLLAGRGGPHAGRCSGSRCCSCRRARRRALPRSTAAPKAATYYLSLGDSLAQGLQPIGGPHTNSSAAGYNQGYADQLLKLARDGGGDQLRLVKLGCGGESTATMIAGGRCSYDTGSQLGDAVDFLDEHQGEIAFITIDLGANDIFLDCRGDPTCFVRQITTNLPHILDTLRGHAGPDVPIVGMNYFGPDVVQWFADPAAGQAAAANTVAFNNLLESLYARAGVPVADVESAFAVTDFTTLIELKHVGPCPSASTTPAPSSGSAPVHHSAPTSTPTRTATA
jgi:lysophospholipase L1-like esterase